DVELETLAQTWSEHCSHKTLKGKIDFDGRSFGNLLKETIFAATQEIRRRLGPDDWCVSVFEDNAGVVRFDDQYHVCFKVETHNHPSAIEPYGGANTGLGGVIRDVLGTGLGAKPVCNTDVFCFAPPDFAPGELPPGVLHPRKVMTGVVSGVRDYGNRMGIPTVNAITEKKVLDVLLQARDRGLYTAITDCGAGGFSSAVGEMGAELGASVQLHNAPLKYAGLSYTEIWISEAQERMVLAVPPAK